MGRQLPDNNSSFPAEDGVNLPDRKSVGRFLPWLNLVLTVALLIAGVWYVTARVSLAAIAQALAHANVGYVVLALAIMLLTLLLKAWRWYALLQKPEQPHPLAFAPPFWAMMLGQYVNLIVPFLRLGELARIYSLNRETGIGPVQVVSTLVVEKTLDLIFFGLTIFAVLPFVVFPDAIDISGSLLVVLPVVVLLLLYFLAFRTASVIRLLRRLAAPLPDRLERLILRLAVAGLEGLASLRSPRTGLLLLALSLMIAALGVLLPYALFRAFDLPAGLLDAALVHIVVSVVVAPPSTPVKIGVFNGAAAFILWQLGFRDEAIIAGYSILFYLIVVIPQIGLGMIAAARSKWRWGAAGELRLQPE